MTDETFALTLVAGPAVEPLTLADAKNWVRHDPDDSSQDAVYTPLIKAARQACEGVARIALVTQTWRLTLDRFPGYGGAGFGGQGSPDYWRLGPDADPRVVRLPRPPLQSISSVKYLDMAGALQTLATSEYVVDLDSQPGRIAPAFGKFWPPTYPVPNAVQVQFVAGYGPAASDVPEDIKLRLRNYVQYCSENREKIEDEYVDCLFLTFRLGEVFG
jgi:hypothetical protein